MDNHLESLMQEISGRLDLMESQLPRRIDALMSRSKLPFKAMLYRESIIWRMAELSRGAFENLQRDKLANAVLLTRAAVETSAALWYLHAKLKAAVESGTLGDTDEYLMRLAMGSRSDAEMPEAISVLTFVDRVNKDVEGFRHQYDRLSEYAHPNWAGTSLLYSKTDAENFWTDFGPNLRGGDGTKSSGVTNLSVGVVATSNRKPPLRIPSGFLAEIPGANCAFVELPRTLARFDGLRPAIQPPENRKSAQ